MGALSTPVDLDIHKCVRYGVRMSKPETVDRVVRVSVTTDEWRKLKVLAVERDMELRELITTALQTSPLTKKVFA